MTNAIVSLFRAVPKIYCLPESAFGKITNQNDLVKLELGVTFWIVRVRIPLGSV